MNEYYTQELNSNFPPSHVHGHWFHRRNLSALGNDLSLGSPLPSDVCHHRTGCIDRYVNQSSHSVRWPLDLQEGLRSLVFNLVGCLDKLFHRKASWGGGQVSMGLKIINCWPFRFSFIFNFQMRLIFDSSDHVIGILASMFFFRRSSNIMLKSLLDLDRNLLNIILVCDHKPFNGPLI